MRLIHDYGNAIISASAGNPLRSPGQAWRVLQARLKHGIGPRFYSLFQLRDIRPAEWPHYLIDEPLKMIQRRLSPPESRAIVDDKLLFHRHCVAHGLPTIPLVCVIDTLPHEGADHARPQRGAELGALVREAADRLFFKLIGGSHGESAFRAERSGGRWSFCGVTGSAEALYDFAMKRLDGERGWLVQPVVTVHEELSRIMSPHGLGTVRMVTYMANGQAHILCSALRITVGRNVADNFMHGTSGNLIAAIEDATGRLAPARGSRRREWPEMISVQRHPGTGAAITGFQMPCWRETRELALRGQESMPHLKSVGWDIAVTSAGPVLVEGNSTYDVDLLQVAFQKGLKPALYGALGVVPPAVELG
jgi:hypothetical protein